jgi:hypothetical protein
MIHTDGIPTIANGAGDPWKRGAREGASVDRWDGSPGTTRELLHSAKVPTRAELLAARVLEDRPKYRRVLATLAGAENGAHEITLQADEASILLDALEALSGQ